jgi:hypothetical protein
MADQPRLHLRAYIWLLVILLVVGAIVYGLYNFFGTRQVSTQTTIQQNGFPAHAPTPTAADQVAAQQPFQYLISYTVSGFHPTTLSAKVGQTIRIIDNAPQQIVIQAPSGSSPTLSQNMYWQYTAAAAGTETFTASNSKLTLSVTK